MTNSVCSFFRRSLVIGLLFVFNSFAYAQASSEDLQKILDLLATQQKRLDAQEAMIQSLQQELASQKRAAVTPASPTPQPAAAAVAAPKSADAPIPAAPAVVAAAASNPQAPATSALVADPQTTRNVSTLMRNLGGFRLGGDMRLRFDLQSRSGTAVAPPLQNARERYRLRLNIDREFLDSNERPVVRVHAQLATAPLNNPLTMDTDFTGIDTRAAISLSEAWIDVNPTKALSFRAGRGSEIHADNLQYVFDDDVRFNGFHETYRKAGKRNFIEFRAGQYILSNPNVPITPAGSPYLAAGYRQGQRIPSTGLFDQGVTFGGNLAKKWTHSWTGNYLVFREVNQIQLASTAAGFAVVTSPEFGATLSGALPQVGNATTTPGGAIYNADRFRILRGAFMLNYSGRQILGHNVPMRLFIQGTKNTGAQTERTGFAAGMTVGQAARRGDVLVQYEYLYKPANGLISQLTDDDVGTGVGVNLRTHAIRLDFGLSRWLAWENRLYIQNPIAPNDPAHNFFVPLPRGAATSVRLQSQFNFTF